jgi:preprotein translocase subunit YajC
MKGGNVMQGYGQFIVMIVVLAVFYAIIFIPESRRRKKYNNMLGSLKVNDQVLTRGGIAGKVINIQDDFIILQTGPDRIKLKLSKNSVANVLNASEEDKKTESK